MMIHGTVSEFAACLSPKVSFLCHATKGSHVWLYFCSFWWVIKMKDLSLHLHMDVTAAECQTLSKLLFSLSLHLSCVDPGCRMCKACSETPHYRLANSIITLKDGNKGTRIICCHTPILINNSILDCAISAVEIRICLKATMARWIWLSASQLRPIRASSMNRSM